MTAEDRPDHRAEVAYELRGKVAYVTFDHVAARNAMTVAMYQSLQSICLEISKNPAIRVLVLRGAGGKAFVAGSDIAQFSDFRSGDNGLLYEEGIDQYLNPLAMLPIPSIAAIEGMAVGGGLAIATCCDFRIATKNARFGVPIAKTLGNCLSSSNLAWLVSHLGVPLVKRILLLAELIPAEELLKQGYLFKVCDEKDLDEAIAELADRLSSLAPITQKSSKQMIARQISNLTTDCQDLIYETYASSDFQNGVKSFLSGAPPTWTGK
jgi:enoyl-CoA hydratase/carnithine racemase